MTAEASVAEAIRTGQEFTSNTIAVTPLLPGLKRGPSDFRVVDDPDDVEPTFTTFAEEHSGVGIAAWLTDGPLVAIGVDAYKSNAGAAVGTLRALGWSRDLPCWAHRTGRGGATLFYRRPLGGEDLHRVVEPDGLPLDLMPKGGVVIPPSSSHRERDGGGPYAWVKDRSPWYIPLVDVAPLPPAILQWWLGIHDRKTTVAKGSSSDTWIADALSGLAPGNRNATFTRIVGKLWHSGLGPADVLAFLSPHAEQCNFPLRELESIVRSIGKYPPGSTPSGRPGSDCDMNAPEHAVNAGVHLLTWLTEGVCVRVDRLRDDRSGITAELLVELISSKGPSHIHFSRLNLLSSSARKALAKACHKRVDRPDLDWGAVIEAATTRVARAHREGDPLLVLQDLPEPSGADAWQLAPILRKNEANIIAADGGTAKSYLALLMACLVSTGHSALGWHPGPTPALYLDWEADAPTHRKRQARIQRGLGLTDIPLVYYRYCVQPLAHEIEDIQRMVAANGIGLVIVDSLGGAVAGEMKDSEPILEYNRALRSLQCTTLTLHHMNRAEGFYGSVYIRNFARNMWELERQQEPGTGALTVGWTHVKANDDALFTPFATTLTWDRQADSVTFAETGFMDVPSFAQKQSIWQQAAHYLKTHHTATPQEIADTIGKLPGTVRREMERPSGQGSGHGSGHIFQKLSGAGVSATYGLAAP